MGNGMKEIVTSFPENSRKVSGRTGYFRSESWLREGEELESSALWAELTIWPPCLPACVKMPRVLLVIL